MLAQTDRLTLIVDCALRTRSRDLHDSLVCVEYVEDPEFARVLHVPEPRRRVHSGTDLLLQDVGFVRAHASVNPGALPWSQVPTAGASGTVRFREKQAEDIERVLRIPR